MEEAPQAQIAVETRTVSMIRLWPWLRLFRCAGVAMDARKLILCALGLVVYSAGRFGLAFLFEGPVEFRIPGTEGSEMLRPSSWLHAPWRALASYVWWPWAMLSEPFGAVLSAESDLRTFGLGLLTAVWGVVVWGFFGGASARVAMLDLARRERVGIWSAMRFAGKRMVTLAGAPLSPLIGLGFFVVLCGLFGLAWYRFLGSVGEMIGGVLFFLPLIAGLVMALMVIGLAVGWPLMVQTVAAESQDAFDALSRSYSYVYQRPWKLAFYGLVALGVGVLGFLFVLLVAGLTVRLALWGVSFGAPMARLRDLMRAPGSRSAETTIHLFWLRFVFVIAVSYLFSYFWTATAMIYLLLRNDVDGATFDDVYREGEEAEPFVPEAASEPETERPSSEKAG